MESGKEAIDKKYMMATKTISKSGTQPVDKRGKYYVRSALVKNLIPAPSDGKVRALFKDTVQPSSLARAGMASIASTAINSRHSPSPAKFSAYDSVNRTQLTGG